MSETLGQLVQMSQRLGEPARDWVILGEGNTSARADATSFWVKASGERLQEATARSFVRVDFAAINQLLDDGDADDATIERALLAARSEPGADRRPSIETLLHAVCLQLDDVRFVAHTHPSAVNSVTCSRDFAKALAGRVFPDEVVVCGPEPVLIPYTDPGLPLAREIRRRIEAHLQRHGAAPKTLLMQNHGLVALAGSARQAEDITAMADKAARILLGTYALGGPRFLDAADVARIHTRPDEARRRRILHPDAP